MTNLEKECSDILNICRLYGYGNVMEWASALWRYDERKHGYGTSMCFVLSHPTFIKKAYQFKDTKDAYDRLVESVMKGLEDVIEEVEE